MADTDQDKLLSYGDLLEMKDALAEENQALREMVKALKEEAEEPFDIIGDLTDEIAGLEDFVNDCVTFRG